MAILSALFPIVLKLFGIWIDSWQSREEKTHIEKLNEFDKSLADGDLDRIAALLSELPN